MRSALYALTKLSTDWLAWPASLPTVTVVLPVLASVNEVPSTTSVSVLVALCTAMPLTVAMALRPVATSVMFCVPAGSWLRRDCSAGSPETAIFISELAPPAVDVSTSRYGELLPSLTMLAETPRLALLMASRMPASVLFDGSMVIEPPAWLPFCVKVAPVYLPSAKLPPETLPNEKVSVVGVPLPMGVLLDACPAADSTCACASCVTLT